MESPEGVPSHSLGCFVLLVLVLPWVPGEFGHLGAARRGGKWGLLVAVGDIQQPGLPVLSPTP